MLQNIIEKYWVKLFKILFSLLFCFLAFFLGMFIYKCPVYIVWNYGKPIARECIVFAANAVPSKYWNYEKTKMIFPPWTQINPDNKILYNVWRVINFIWLWSFFMLICIFYINKINWIKESKIKRETKKRKTNKV